MGEFDFEKLDREVDDLLADVKGLLDEPEEDEAELDDLEEDETEPEDAEDDAEAGEAEDAVSDDRTIIFRPLTAAAVTCSSLSPEKSSCSIVMPRRASRSSSFSSSSCAFWFAYVPSSLVFGKTSPVPMMVN